MPEYGWHVPGTQHCCRNAKLSWAKRKSRRNRSLRLHDLSVLVDRAFARTGATLEVATNAVHVRLWRCDEFEKASSRTT